uniref:Uncharacterized protein n=1 Tax=Arundo donax TaxID=35708 RepID=A0A0A9CZS7_ARUDO
MNILGIQILNNLKSYHKHTSFSSASVDEYSDVSSSIFSRKPSMTSRLLSSTRQRRIIDCG